MFSVADLTHWTNFMILSSFHKQSQVPLLLKGGKFFSPPSCLLHFYQTVCFWLRPKGQLWSFSFKASLTPALWPKANNKALNSPWNNGDFYQASEHPFSFRGLKRFHVCNNFVYSVCIHTKLQQGDNKLAANCSWWG